VRGSSPPCGERVPRLDRFPELDRPHAEPLSRTKSQVTRRPAAHNLERRFVACYESCASPRATRPLGLRLVVPLQCDPLDLPSTNKFASLVRGPPDRSERVAYPGCRFLARSDAEGPDSGSSPGREDHLAKDATPRPVTDAVYCARPDEDSKSTWRPASSTRRHLYSA